jgi:hypothetical protein
LVPFFLRQGKTDAIAKIKKLPNAENLVMIKYLNENRRVLET